jgi:hypothetical protein
MRSSIMLYNGLFGVLPLLAQTCSAEARLLSSTTKELINERGLYSKLS